MTPDNESATGVTDLLITEMGLAGCVIRRDEILLIGVKNTFANLATPETEQGPMDHPTMGIALICGPDCSTKPPITPAMLCYFTKFSGIEVSVNNRRFFVVKASDVKMTREITMEECENLARNSY